MRVGQAAPAQFPDAAYQQAEQHEERLGDSDAEYHDQVNPEVVVKGFLGGDEDA